MTVALATALGLLLTAIAALHLYWAFGGLWPARDEATLVRTVVGDPRLRRMPAPMLCVGVAAAIDAAALIAFAQAFRLAPRVDAVVTAAGGLAALTFLGRGAAGYLPPFRRRFSAEPFATLDRRWFSPLCLALGAAFLVLVLQRFS